MSKKFASPSIMGGDAHQRHHHLVVLYDSILNSVFESQVLQPLLHKNQPITIISFESNQLSAQKIASLVPSHISFIEHKKYPFMGIWSLAPAIYTLKKTLRSFAHYTINARGPLAGYVALQAQTALCAHLTIQARGILAEEYGYAHRAKQTYWVQGWHSWRKSLYQNLEQQTYAHTQQNLTFEAVSPALKEYLVATYKSDPKNIVIAQHDIPHPISTQQKAAWRTATRTALGISENAHVYCYNGSAKAWQCPAETIAFFAQTLKKNNNALLLILSQDQNAFLTLLQKAAVPQSNFRLVSAQHHQIFQYLAAADTGLLLREDHIVNWVSRPTKALEYQALSLPIIHNNTVAYLQENGKDF